MKAVAIFPERKEVQLVECAEPTITQPTQAKLRMLEVGICGTDRHICAGYFGTPPRGNEYLILGHEALGQVVEVGSAVQTVQPGNLVVPMVRRPCLEADCRSCRAGQQDFCATNRYTERGIMALHGYMADYVVDEAAFLHVVPPQLREVAVLTEPLTIAEKAVREFVFLQQRLSWLDPTEPGKGLAAVVLGAGPIGLLGAMKLVSAGFDTYVYSRTPVPNEKAEIVEAIGARYISSNTTSIRELATQVGHIDFVYEAIGPLPLAAEIIPVLARNGVIVFTSDPNLSSLYQNYGASGMRALVGRNQAIIGTVNAGYDDFTDAIRDLGLFHQRWPRQLQALISNRWPREQAGTLLQEQPGGIKHVITLVP